VRVNSADDALAEDDHLQLLAWLDEHPTGSRTDAAQALDLVDAGMVERTGLIDRQGTRLL